jgi:Zn-dependent peptidase ImmA (M78 family)
VVRRGFKTEAEELALEIRAELKLAPQARLIPTDLAEHLGVPVLSLQGLAPFEAGDNEGDMSLGDAVALFTGPSREKLSAFTVAQDTHRLIVYNESHPETRQANSLAHELSHILLEHEPSPHSDQYGHRFWSPEVEEEANLLAAALLVPREGARIVLESGRSEAQAAKHFGVSLQLFQWRAWQTGVLRQLAYASASTEGAADDPA